MKTVDHSKPQVKSSRSTRTAIKALKPLTPTKGDSEEDTATFVSNQEDNRVNSEQQAASLDGRVVIPPTLPNWLSPDNNFRIFPFPTIS